MHTMSRTKRTIPEFILALDRMPDQERLFHGIRRAIASLASFYGFSHMSTSFMEDAATFFTLAKAGMLDERQLADERTARQSGVTPRPSVALSLIRAYATHAMHELPHPLKLSGEGEVVYAPSGARGVSEGRYEWGMVMIGEEGPIAEAELIQVLTKAVREAGVDTAAMLLRVNATGCRQCRPLFRAPFTAYFRNRLSRMCRTCRTEFKRVPTALLRCKEEQCQIVASGAPQMLDFLCDVCKKHMKGILEFLDEAQIPYFLDGKLFREGSWFTTILFELSVTPSGLEKNSEAPALVIGEGGRISRAAEIIIGKPVEAVSATLFFDSTLRALSQGGKKASAAPRTRVFLVQLGDLAKRRSLTLIEDLRRGGIDMRESLGRDSVKSQLKIAETIGAEVALILGQKEALEHTVIVREVASGIQETIPQERLVEFLKRKLKK